MTDVLERLRADNPIPKGSAPGFNEVWRRLERDPRTPQRRPSGLGRVRTVVLASLALVPAAAVVVLALTLEYRPGAVRSGVPAGSAIVHYRVRIVWRPPSGAATYAYEMSTSDVWISGSSSHSIGDIQFFSRSGGLLPGWRLLEKTTNLRRVEIFSLGSTYPRGDLTVGPAQTGGNPCGLFFWPPVLVPPLPRLPFPAVGEFCGEPVRDPAQVLGVLSARRQLRIAARDLHRFGRPVDELRLSDWGWRLQIFVKSGTFVPVEVVGHPDGAYPSVTASISDYQRMPFPAADHALLQMRPHPDSILFCLNAAGGVRRVTRLRSCFSGARKPIPGASHRRVARKQIPLPAVLVRSFSVLRGLVNEQAKAIPNGIGWKIWVVPEITQTCLKVSIPQERVGGGGGDCVPNRKALAGKFSPAFFGPGERVIGLAPNGNETVTLTLSDGSTRTVGVSRNVYTLQTSRVIRTVTLKDSSGVLRTWKVPDGVPG